MHVGSGKDPGTLSAGRSEGGFLINSEDDRGRPRLGVALLASKVFARTDETGDLGKRRKRMGWDCEVGIGVTGRDMAGVSLRKVNDGVRDGGVPAGEAAMGPNSGENRAIDMEGR